MMNQHFPLFHWVWKDRTLHPPDSYRLLCHFGPDWHCDHHHCHAHGLHGRLVHHDRRNGRLDRHHGQIHRVHGHCCYYYSNCDLLGLPIYEFRSSLFNYSLSCKRSGLLSDLSPCEIQSLCMTSRLQVPVLSV